MSEIKEIPLLYQTPMVNAILEDRKSMTRRERGLEGLNNHYFQSLVLHATGHFTFVENGNYCPKKEDVKVVKCPYGKPGDLLWVRETWARPYICGPNDKEEFFFKANPQDNQDATAVLGYKWKPSIHMPKEASRMWLMVEGIRVERLHDITEEDAIAEGIEKHPHFNEFKWYLTLVNGSQVTTPNPIDSFASLWMSINGTESWESNPWVWVVKFRTLSKTGRPTDREILNNLMEINNQPS